MLIGSTSLRDRYFCPSPDLCWTETDDVIGKENPQLRADILRVMFKKLHTCLQLGNEKAGFVFLLCDKNWLKIFINRVKSETVQTCTLQSATSYFDCSTNIYCSKNWRLSQADEFLSEPVVEIIGINWAKVILHSSSI